MTHNPERLQEETHPDIQYSPEWDSFYYADTGEWVEPCCGDKDCRFCIHRPKKMEAKKEWVSLTYKELIHLAFGKTDLEEFYWAIDAALKERNDMKAERVAKTEKDRHEKFCDNHCVWTDHHPDCPLKE